MERMTSDERLILIKDLEEEYLKVLFDTIQSARHQILETSIVETDALLKRPMFDGNLAHGYETTLLLVKCMGADEKLREIIDMIKDAQDCLESCVAPVDYLKTIKKRNKNLLDLFQNRGLDEAVKFTRKFMKDSKELFSVEQLEAQLALEEKEEMERADKVISKNKKKETVCKVQEVIKPVSQQQILADKINERYNDLCDVKRDLPNTYNTRESVEKFTTRLNNIAKNYKLPMDASRSLGCYRQAEVDIDKVYDELENIKNISTQNYIAGRVIYQQ